MRGFPRGYHGHQKPLEDTNLRIQFWTMIPNNIYILGYADKEAAQIWTADQEILMTLKS